ncbi:hypothetical protein [Amycolatopsis pithecellobii]|uniref:hypothetical protein n=1 Tax=Amycolatopsis pithecellobii TaxID=664692 RepID=UPI001AA0A924|nr:hypothetical protein [Amycolatopsis pithecellobii]
MSKQTIALVTGANQGIGYEIAGQPQRARLKCVGVGDRNWEHQQDAVLFFSHRSGH